MKHKIIFKHILFLFLAVGVLNKNHAQSTYKTYKKLSTAEKCWVITHPFKAKKAYRTTQSVTKTVDSLLKIGVLGNHYIGNQLDAFKHAFWMWSLADSIGYYSAKSLGKQHEKGNYQFFKKHQSEDGVLPDKISSEMDLFNNTVGLTLYKKHKKEHLSEKEKIEIVLQYVQKGKMKMIYQTKNRQFINKEGQIIPKQDYEGLWENTKCLVPSSDDYLMADNKSKYLNLLDQKTNK